MTAKFKVWNSITKEWFVPTYPNQNGSKTTIEVFLSQGGDLFIHEKNEAETIIHAPHLIPCVYTGCKDETGKKIYDNDVVLCGVENKSIGYIKIHSGTVWIASGEAGNPINETSTSIHELQKCKVVGNILETPDYFHLLKNV